MAGLRAYSSLTSFCILVGAILDENDVSGIITKKILYHHQICFP
jgi:hypothetical protein